MTKTKTKTKTNAKGFPGTIFVVRAPEAGAFLIVYENSDDIDEGEVVGIYTFSDKATKVVSHGLVKNPSGDPDDRTA